MIYFMKQDRPDVHCVVCHNPFKKGEPYRTIDGKQFKHVDCPKENA